MKLTLIDYFTATIVACGLYIGACFIDMNRKINYYHINSIVVENGYNTGQIRSRMNGSKIDPETVNINANPGDTIHVEFHIERYRSATVLAERIFEDSNDKQYVVNQKSHTIDRSNMNTTVAVAEFRVPIFARGGCGSDIYVRANYELTYNIVTHLRPVLLETPKLKVCVLNQNNDLSAVITNWP